MENKKSKFTIEKLATATQKGFIQLEKKLSNRIDKLEVKVDRLEDKFDKLEVKVDRLEEKFDKLEIKVDIIEKKVEKGVDRMLEIADGIAGKFLLWKEENEIGTGVQKIHEDQLENHENRLQKIE